MIRRFLKTPIVAVAMLALVGGLGAWWWHARNGPKVSFRTAIVKRSEVAATITASGAIEPEEVVDIGAQVAGRISSFGTDILRTALHALRRNVMRSVLTCLGIIIGIAAVIAMMEIGGGSSRSIEQAIASLGAGVVQVDPADISIGGVSSGRGGRVAASAS